MKQPITRQTRKTTKDELGLFPFLDKEEFVRNPSIDLYTPKNTKANFRIGKQDVTIRDMDDSQSNLETSGGEKYFFTNEELEIEPEYERLHGAFKNSDSIKNNDYVEIIIDGLVGYRKAPEASPEKIKKYRTQLAAIRRNRLYNTAD